MCCCFFRKGTFCLARWWHAIIYITIGLTILFCYLGLSIAFYIECYSLSSSSYFPFQCGSNAMWSCMGWVPLLFFFIVTFLTFYYYFKQSVRTTKLITSSDAWLILFITIACCILYFIHICYLAYISIKLSDNPGCDPYNDLYPQIPSVNCSKASTLISILLFFAILLIIFICSSLTILFALVNQRIATPVNYTTVTKDDMEMNNNNFERIENLAQYKLGERVIVRLSYDNKIGCNGTVRWYGQVKSTEYPTESTTSLPFLYGVHLDEKKGNCDGSIGNKEPIPFKCPMGFGIFVPINHIKKLLPENDPTIQSNNNNIEMTSAVVIDKSINKGLVITRDTEPNHLILGNLFYFLRDLRLAGIVNYSKIGVMDYSNKIESIKTKSMISIIFPITNECIYNYLPLLSSTSEYNEIFNPERTERNNNNYENNNCGDEDEKKEKEEDINLPIVNIYYLNLHESWYENSLKIKANGVLDYQSSQWVRQSEQRAIDWYHMLGIQRNNAIKQAKTRFDQAPLPMFLNIKQSQNEEQKNNGLYKAISSHYVPLGIFYSINNNNNFGIDQSKVAWLEPSPIPNIINELNMKIELRLKRLIHEPVMNMQHILPYLHSKQYQIDKEDNNYGWFPIDWVYAEVDIDDNILQNKFNMSYLNYTPPYHDDIINKDSNSYNPYWFMKFPRIPLFVLSLRLPLEKLKKFAVQIVNIKYGQHSPVQQQNNSRHPVINQSISIDQNNNNLHHRHHHKKKPKKSKYNQKHYKNNNNNNEYSHEIPPKPKAKYKSYENEPAEVSVSVEMELTEVEQMNAIAMNHKRNKNKQKNHQKKSKSHKNRYESVNQSDDSNENDTDIEYDSNDSSVSDNEETISNDDKEEESDEDSEDEYETDTNSNSDENSNDENDEYETDSDQTETNSDDSSHQHKKIIFKRNPNNRYADSPNNKRGHGRINKHLSHSSHHSNRKGNKKYKQ